MAKLRGSKESLFNAVIESLKVIQGFEDPKQMREGIQGLINFLVQERDQFKK